MTKVGRATPWNGEGTEDGATKRLLHNYTWGVWGGRGPETRGGGLVVATADAGDGGHNETLALVGMGSEGIVCMREKGQFGVWVGWITENIK